MHMNGFFVRWTMVVWKNPDDSSTLWKEGCIRKNETALVIMLHLLKITSFLAWALHFETEPRLLLPISYMAHSHSAAFFCWIRYALQEKCIVCRFYRGILHFCGVTLSFSRSTAQYLTRIWMHMNATFAACCDAQLPSIYPFILSNFEAAALLQGMSGMLCVYCNSIPFLKERCRNYAQIKQCKGSDTNAKGGRHSWHFGIWDLVCLSMSGFWDINRLNSVQPETLSGLSGATHIQYREAETNLTFMSVAGQILKHVTLMLYAGSRAAKQLWHGSCQHTAWFRHRKSAHDDPVKELGRAVKRLALGASMAWQVRLRLHAAIQNKTLATPTTNVWRMRRYIVQAPVSQQRRFWTLAPQKMCICCLYYIHIYIYILYIHNIIYIYILYLYIYVHIW